MKTVLLISIIFFGLRVEAQIDILKYYRSDAYYSSLVSGFQKLEFKWTLPGNLQIEMNEGLNAIEENNFEIGATHFTNLLEIDSTFAPAHYYRGVCYKMMRKLNKAETDYLKATELLPKPLEPYLELGDLNILKGRVSKASNYYQKAIKIDPTSTVSQFKMGILSLYKSEEKKAIRYFEACNKLKPDFPDAHLAIGIIKFKDKLTRKESIDFFAKSIDADKNFAMGYFWRGLTFSTMNDNLKAEADWNKAIELSPSNIFLLEMRGFLLIELKKYENAFTDLRKAMEAHQVDENDAQFNGTSLDKKIELQNACAYLLRFGYGLDEKAFVSLKKSFCMLIANKNKEAIGSASEAQRIEPSAAVMYLKAIAYQFAEKHDSAFHYYSKTFELDKDIFDVNKNLAIYQSNLKNWKGAMFHVSRMRQLQPRSEITWRLSGLIKAELKDYYGAVIDLTRYLKTDTADEVCLLNRAIVRREIEDYKGSNEDYLRLQLIKPNDLYIPLAISANYFLLADTARSVEVLRDTQKKHPSIVQVNFFLIDRLIDAHQLEEAKTILNKMDKYTSVDGLNRAWRDYLKSKLYFAQGKTEKAFRELEKLIDSRGELDEYLVLRVKIYLREGNLELAKKDLKKLKANKYTQAKKWYSKYGI